MKERTTLMDIRTLNISQELKTQPKLKGNKEITTNQLQKQLNSKRKTKKSPNKVTNLKILRNKPHNKQKNRKKRKNLRFQ